MNNWWQIWVFTSDWNFVGWYFSKGQTLAPNDRTVIQRLARGFAGQTASKVWVQNAGTKEVVEEDGWACAQPMGVSGTPSVEWSN